MIEAPSVLSSRAREKWEEILSAWPRMKRPPNADVLAAYCTAYQRWYEAEEWLAMPEHSTVMTIRDDKGVIKSHGLVPQVRLAEAAAKEMSRLGKALGLNK